MNEDGFLATSWREPSGSDGGDIVGRLLPLQDALRSGAVVLLGEPGLGKSTEFRRLREYGDAGGLRVEEPVDGADLADAASFEELVGCHLRTLPPKPVPAGAATASGRPTPGLVIIIDQVDECPILQQLAGHLRRALDGRDTAGLRLVLGCRTADYPANLTVVLRTACGSCHLADLAPLTRAEATALASSVEGVDGEALVAAAVECGAGALASVPLTLELLVGTYRRRGSLDALPVDLFADGVLQLLDEHDSDRSTVNGDSTPSQRQAVAERIAVRLVLSGRRTIWRGRARSGGPGRQRRRVRWR
ncbi:NACHT domain-containing protein [Dactylosporangium sp. CA-092794]|uniref:NACHT domain-containing protein n=1 Tax=Dactylosporangium sp. CA-092794 TaxID=3239929 RepID=UPI003D900341